MFQLVQNIHDESESEQTCSSKYFKYFYLKYLRFRKMGPEGIILANSPITTFQQSLTHSECAVNTVVTEHSPDRRVVQTI